MADVNTQQLTAYRGEDAAYPFAPPAAENITGWAIAFHLSAAPGGALLSGYPLTTAGGAVVITSAAAGQFSVTIPAALTTALSAGTTYHWDVWRTDAGQRERLAGGTLRAKEPVRRP